MQLTHPTYSLGNPLLSKKINEHPSNAAQRTLHFSQALVSPVCYRRVHSQQLNDNSRATVILGDFYVARGCSDQTKWRTERRSTVEALFTVLNNKHKGLFSVNSYILPFPALIFNTKKRYFSVVWRIR